MRVWREENASAPSRDFWPWFAEECFEIYNLTLEKGERPELVDSWKVYIDGTNENASGSTLRKWLKKMPID